MLKRLGALAVLLGAPAYSQVLNEGNTSNVYSLPLVNGSPSGIPSTNIAVGGSATNLLTPTPATADAFGNITTAGMISSVGNSVSAQSLVITGAGQGMVAVQVANGSGGTANQEIACWNGFGKAITCLSGSTTGIIGIVYTGGAPSAALRP